MQMYISLKDSCANGFKKWADTHQPEIKHDLRASGGNGLARCHGRGLALDCDPFPLRTRVEAGKRVELGDHDGPFRNRLGSLEMGRGRCLFPHRFREQPHISTGQYAWIGLCAALIRLIE
jgi:hypothetical protein